MNITNFTMLSDCRNSSKIERVGDTVPGSATVSRGCIDGGLLWRLLDDRWREQLPRCGKRDPQAGRNPSRPAVAANTGDEQFECDEHLPVAANPLVEQHGRAANLDDPGIDDERVIEPRRAAIIGGEPPHRENRP